MRRIVQQYFVSLDGVVQAPGGEDEDTEGGFAHGGWAMPYLAEAVSGFVDAGVDGARALLFGRRTYEIMAAWWPEQDEGADPFAALMNEIDKHVVSSTLSEGDVEWNNSHLVSVSDVSKSVDAVADLRANGDGDLLMMGSSALGRELLAADLVDELRLMTIPVVLGGGKSAFPDDGGIHHFALVESTVTETGVICSVYRPADAPAPAETGA